jgi:hypothetical protein
MLQDLSCQKSQLLKAPNFYGCGQSCYEDLNLNFEKVGWIIHTWCDRHNAVLIKAVIKIGSLMNQWEMPVS